MFDNPREPSKPGVLTSECVNIFHGQWPGLRTQESCRRQGHVYRTLPNKVAKPASVGPEGEEDRLVFLHREGEEELSSAASDEGGEFSRCNRLEVETAVQVYKEIYLRLTGVRRANPASSVAIISQYRYQVSAISTRIRQLKLPMPTVKTVIACQGSEFDYVILSLVRSCPRFLIPRTSVLSWELKFLGFITDENQINVALTRARRGLFIIGNSHLLRVNEMWNRLLKRLDSRGCILKSKEASFPFVGESKQAPWFHPDSAEAKAARANTELKSDSDRGASSDDSPAGGDEDSDCSDY
ncbi:hypothetical protein BOX15_Mlig024320g1 [Macrostomum lignano]|nr:hypothetical protein BOX15_Mlig024320g1 [Macrostomum lignano]